MATASQWTAPVTIFYSYAHEDETLRDELETHLSLLKREGRLSEWHDRQIRAGQSWADEISVHLETADVILLLVSADFLASNYCWSQEMHRALERQLANQARVIPIILRPVDWQSAPFSSLQVLPKNATPITSWANRDEAWTDVAIGIRRVIEGDRHVTTSLPRTETLRSERETSMPDTKGSQDRSVRIGGNVTGSAIIAGDRNVVTLHYEKISLPPAASVDMHAELDALREVLMRLETPDRKKIKNALSEAKEEMTKAAPDKDEVGTALNRALSYAQKAEGFARAIETLKPHVGNAAAWFGSNWHKILAVVGLAV